MYKNYRKGTGGNNRRTTYMDIHAEKASGGKRSEGTINDWLSFRAMKDLPRSSYGIKADPYTEANEVATAYPLLNSFNRHIEANYMGDKNLASGNLPQYVNSYKSGFLNSVDSLAMRILMNYRYLPISKTLETDNRGVKLVDKTKESIAEAISLLGATTYTELAINDYYIATDMQMGTDYGEGKMGHGISVSGFTGLVYTHPVDVLYGMLMMYQTYLQNNVGFISQFNRFRGLQKEMMRMCWDRETPTLNELFSITNKKAFLSKLDSIGLIVEGEYFDSNWCIQSNLISNLVGRKSESVVDPLLEVMSYHIMPKNFVCGFLDGEGMPLEGGKVFDVHGLDSTYGSLEDIFNNWSEEMSAQANLYWARNIGLTTDTSNATERYNSVFVDPVGKLSMWGTYFKTSFNDLRVALDTLVRTGVITWSKGYRPKVSSITDAPVFDNLIVSNIYTSTFCGSPEIKFNNVTKRWSNYSLWNMYSGIPAYDEFAGGAFLAISTKAINITEGDDDGNIGYLPRAFLINRLGTRAPIVMIDRTGSVYQCDVSEVTMSDDSSLARLVPLASQDGLKIRVPYVKSVAPAQDDENMSKVSWATKVLVRVFGLGHYNSSDDVQIDPDIFSVYQYEIEDLTNEAIAYIKEYGPFRGSGDAKSSLGFFGVKK